MAVGLGYLRAGHGQSCKLTAVGRDATVTAVDTGKLKAGSLAPLGRAPVREEGAEMEEARAGAPVSNFLNSKTQRVLVTVTVLRRVTVSGSFGGCGRHEECGGFQNFKSQGSTDKAAVVRSRAY